MAALQNPELPWIDLDLVIDLAQKRLVNSVKKVQNDTLDQVYGEPTLAIVRSGLTGKPLEESPAVDAVIALTKTIQNAVGLLHQDILGSVDGWTTTGTSGGVVDLKGFSPVLQKNIVAEIKMRYNTIKQSDEKNVWDLIKNAVSFEGKGATGYIFQVIPKQPIAYDLPWQVSGRPANEMIRCVDGVTAYHLVTGHKDALFQLMRVMPFVITTVLNRLTGDSLQAEIAFNNQEFFVEKLLIANLPTESFYAND